MLFQIESVTAGNLNAGTEQIVTVTDKEIERNYGGPDRYRPVSIRFNNNTGDDISVAMFTDKEYAKYQIDSNISDLYMIPDTVDYEFKNMLGEITTIIVVGTTGIGHATNLSIYIRQE
jgi:hypothetical protein